MSIFDNILGTNLRDIILTGFIELNSGNELNTSYFNEEHIYLDFHNFFLLLAYEEEQDTFNISIENKIEFNFSIDDEDQYVSTSIHSLFITDTVSELQVSRVVVYSDANKMKALELILSNDQQLFFDSTYFTGIKMGEEYVKKIFIENHLAFKKEIFE